MSYSSPNDRAKTTFILDYRGKANVAIEPSVGLFWSFQLPTGDLFVINEKLALAAATPYGECLTLETGHYEIWDKLRHVSAAEFRTTSLPPFLRDMEYEAIPRGRVVYEKPNDLFNIYADRRLHVGSFPLAILVAFGLRKANYKFARDDHYQ